MTNPETLPHPEDPNWSRRALVALGVIGALALLALVGAAFLPRWWAQRIGDQAQGSITTGTFLGLFYGFVFTLLPLVLLWVAFRLLRTWRLRIGAIAVAAIVAAPNLLTLGIVLGSGNGAHAGDRILDVEAPAFRGGTLAGVLVAVGCLATAWYLLASRRRARLNADELDTQSRTTPSDAEERSIP